MITSKMEIANIALAHLGPDLSTANFDTDQSRAAKLCRTFYYQSLREMLNDHPWPFATIMEKMTIAQWYFSRERRFAYIYPAHALKVRRLFAWDGRNRNDDQRSRQRYKIIETPLLGPPIEVNGAWCEGAPVIPQQLSKVILADHPGLYVEYTADEELITRFDAKFIQALAWKMAYYMAPALTGGDPYKLGDRAKMNYEVAFTDAAAEASNEEAPDQVRAGEFIDDRQGPWGEHGPHGFTQGMTPNYPSGYQVENS